MELDMQKFLQHEFDEASFTLDTEVRRQMRMKRLNRHIEIEKVEEEAWIPSVEKQFQLKEKESNTLGQKFLQDICQHNSILSDAPAICLESGAGTGKTTVLAGRIAHLLRTKQIEPKNMIILSFTKRDAIALKEKAMNILYQDSSCELPERADLENQLWCGTIHSFAINILRKYNCNDTSLRIISSKEMKNRVRYCLGRINGSKERMMLYRNALEDSRQSIGTLVQYIVRCLELWKEAGILSTPYAYSINFGNDVKEASSSHDNVSKDDYVELAMRLGVPQNAALMALDIAGDYQASHAGMGTADPSDVAMMAYDFLMTEPDTLSEVRSRLRQVVLDEYQDVSVSQHKLLRLIMLGPEDKELRKFEELKKQTKMPIMLGNSQRQRSRNKHSICYHVPKLICAGDANQSIYGWRGAAPSLTVEGFRRDFPQGLVVPLGTNYRLPRHILNAANVLLGQEEHHSNEKSYEISPAAALAASNLVESIVDDKKVDEANGKLKIGEKLMVEEGLMSESRSSVHIQGLWDAREEAKFIAADIRKKSKERSSGFAKAIKRFFIGDKTSNIHDLCDVAVMVRNANQLKLIEEALGNYGIPYIVPKETGKGKSQSSLPVINVARGQHKNMLRMKPVKLITMHKAKGDEFDDVYLAGWTEGSFPHPSSVKTNRVHEERRIAYVALTRARQRVVVTYSNFKRVSYFNAEGMKKDVTEPVKPSRFLYDLMSISSSQSTGSPKSIEWSESYGFKDHIAGQNVPEQFAKSYHVPNGYTKEKVSANLPRSQNNHISFEEDKAKEKTAKKVDSKKNDLKKDDPVEELLLEVKKGLESIENGDRGAKGKYKKIFRSLLKGFGISRGSAAILTKNCEHLYGKGIDSLIKANNEHLTTKALSRCTAEQLGLYIYYLLHQCE